MSFISRDITTSFHGKKLRAHDWGAHARPVKGLCAASEGAYIFQQHFSRLFSRFYRDLIQTLSPLDTQWRKNRDLIQTLPPLDTQ